MCFTYTLQGRQQSGSDLETPHFRRRATHNFLGQTRFYISSKRGFYETLFYIKAHVIDRKHEDVGKSQTLEVHACNVLVLPRSHTMNVCMPCIRHTHTHTHTHTDVLLLCICFCFCTRMQSFRGIADPRMNAILSGDR